MRLFLAIELPDAVRTHLAGITAHNKVGYHLVVEQGREHRISSTRPENLHVTLKFLGEVEECAVPKLCEGLRRVRAEPTAEVWVGHIELLPPRGPVRVVAAGLDGDVARLELVHRAVEAECEEQGFPPERRAYRPHITVHRCREPLPGHMRGDLEQLYGGYFPGPRFRVEGFSLIQSHLLPEGPQYARIADFPLNRA